MELIKIVIMIAVTMGLSITLTMTSIGNNNNMEQAQESEDSGDQVVVRSGGRVSRFLAEKAAANPKAADHCKKDNEACYVHGLNATTCCNNKCVDVYEDDKNCGGCKSKCKYTDTCCRGKCVDTDYDKRHCGACGNKCKPGVLCLYGMCEYSI